MTVETDRFYRFDPFLLDAAERELRHGDTLVPLTPKVFDTLVYLVRNSGHLVTKDEVMAAVWPDSFVEEGNLPRTIHTLRRSLGEDRNGNKFIQTLPTKGYRFVAEVEKTDSPGFAEVRASDGSRTSEFLDTANGRIQDGLIIAEVRPGRRMILYIAAAIFLAILVMGFWYERGTAGKLVGVRGLFPQTTNGRAYQYFREGKVLLEGQLAVDFKTALDDFEKAIELDPNFAAAYAGRADARIQSFWLSGSHDDISLARKSINKALELEPSSSYAHTLLCRLNATYDWDFPGAEAECRRAIDLDPGNADARREMAMLLIAVGRNDEALTEIENAVELAPTSSDKRQRGMILYFSGRYDEAIAQLQQTEETDPEYTQCTLYIAKSFEMKKDWQNALAYYMRQRQRIDPSGDGTALTEAFERGGWPAVLATMAQGPHKLDFQYAGTLAQLGEYDKAIEVLNDMGDRRRVMLVQSAREPRLEPLKNDPRFRDLLKRIGVQ